MASHGQTFKGLILIHTPVLPKTLVNTHIHGTQLTIPNLWLNFVIHGMLKALQMHSSGKTKHQRLKIQAGLSVPSKTTRHFYDTLKSIDKELTMKNVFAIASILTCTMTWAELQPLPEPVTPAKASGCSWPAYPAQAMANSEQGTTRVSIHILADGSVANATVVKSSGYADLDNATLAAIKGCQFHPSTKDGTPTDSTAELDYVWSIPIPSGIEQVLNSNRKEIQAIYRKELNTHPSLRGKFATHLKIDKDGHVNTATIDASNLHDGVLESQLLDYVRNIKFPVGLAWEGSYAFYFINDN